MSGLSKLLKISPLDKYGVRISRSPMRRPLLEWHELQNGERLFEGGLKGITKRGGMAAHNTTVLAGPILAMSNVPLTSLFDVPVGSGDLAFALDSGANNWAFSDDSGATFTPEDRGAFAGGTSNMYGQENAVTIDGNLYFPNTGLFMSDPVTLMQMGAGAAVEFVGTADWPTFTGAAPSFINGMTSYLGTIYVHLVYSILGVATSQIVTVDPDTAAVTAFGSTFETSSRERYGVVVADEHVFAVRRGAAGESGIYSSPIATPSWSLELMPAAPTDFHPGAIIALDDDVYVGGQPNLTPNDPIVLLRVEGAGSFSVDETFPVASGNPNPPLLVVQGVDLLCFIGEGTGSTVEVWIRSGGVWSLDEDLTAAFPGVSGPFTMAVADGSDVLIGDIFTGTILKRSAAGAWTNPSTIGAALRSEAGRAG